VAIASVKRKKKSRILWQLQVQESTKNLEYCGNYKCEKRKEK
jgi:hypothetical protein